MQHINNYPKGFAEPSPPSPFSPRPETLDESALAAARTKIIKKIGYSSVPVDELARECHLSLSLVLMVLLDLELAGRLERQAGNKVVLIG